MLAWGRIDSMSVAAIASLGDVTRQAENGKASETGRGVKVA